MSAKLIDGDVANFVGLFEPGCDFRWPLDAPNNGLQVLVAMEPDSTNSVFAGITEANVVWHVSEESGAEGGALSDDVDDGYSPVRGCRGCWLLGFGLVWDS